MVVAWIERFFYAPTRFQKLLSYLLAPLSWLYCGAMFLRFTRTTLQDYGIPIISIGNLTVGGSGKTPLVTALVAHFEHSAIVLRGYGRQSKGLLVISDGQNILQDVALSGDEAMIYAQKLNGCVVIVSEDRGEGIEKAKSMGCKVIFLDDAYSKHPIQKLDLLIDVETPNRFCLPAGPFRERHWSGKTALHVKEGVDFKRRVTLQNPSDNMILITAIARPERLDPFLPEGVEKHYFPDHHFFTKEEVQALITQSGATSIIVTYKDYVKLEAFGFAMSLLDLELELDETLLGYVEGYVREER